MKINELFPAADDDSENTPVMKNTQLKPFPSPPLWVKSAEAGSAARPSRKEPVQIKMYLSVLLIYQTSGPSSKNGEES